MRLLWGLYDPESTKKCVSQKSGVHCSKNKVKHVVCFIRCASACIFSGVLGVIPSGLQKRTDREFSGWQIRTDRRTERKFSASQKDGKILKRTAEFFRSDGSFLSRRTRLHDWTTPIKQIFDKTTIASGGLKGLREIAHLCLDLHPDQTTPELKFSKQEIQY